MSKEPSYNRYDRESCEEYARETWGPIIAAQNVAINELKAKLAETKDRNTSLEYEASHGRALIKMLKEIQENPTTKGYWDKIMMMLKLTESNT